jgi:hypothetical protein
MNTYAHTHAQAEAMHHAAHASGGGGAAAAELEGLRGEVARLEAELGNATDQMEGLRSVLEAQADGGGGDGAAVSAARVDLRHYYTCALKSTFILP